MMIRPTKQAMKLYIGKGTHDLSKMALWIKQDAQTSILPAWLSPDQAAAWASTFGTETEIKELDLAEYKSVADWHRDSGINLLVQIRGLQEYREKA